MTLRPDLSAIADLVPPQTKVLDLGCGDGALLAYLVYHKQVVGRGIELSEQGVLACVRRGLSVRQGNLVEGMADHPDNSFEYVILSQTLPFLNDPALVVREMLRVGRYAVVSFANWGNWRCRLQLLLSGRIPTGPDLPQPWYEAPRWQALTVTDFAQFSRQIGVEITTQHYLAAGRQIHPPTWIKNLIATTAIFTLQDGRSER